MFLLLVDLIRIQFLVWDFVAHILLYPWVGWSLELVIPGTSWIIKEDVYIMFIVIALRDSDNERS